MTFQNILRAALATALCVPLLQGAAQAQAYPDKPIRMIVPFAAGSATDLLARIVSAEIGTSSNMQIVVDNRPGAGGTIGTAVVAKAPADGYTLLLTPPGTRSIPRSIPSCRTTPPAT